MTSASSKRDDWLGVVRRGQPFCADEDLPRLDADSAELLCGRPGIVREAAADLGFAFRIGDQQHPDASPFGAGERPGEEDEAPVRERVHERCVLGR